MNLDPELQELLLIIGIGGGIGLLMAAPVLIRHRRATGRWLPEERPDGKTPAWFCSNYVNYFGLVLFGGFSAMSFIFLEKPYYGIFFLLLTLPYIRNLLKQRPTEA